MFKAKDASWDTDLTRSVMRSVNTKIIYRLAIINIIKEFPLNLILFLLPILKYLSLYLEVNVKA